MALSPCIDISASDRQQLLLIANQSIDSGLSSDRAYLPDCSELSGNLLAPFGTFVTLTKQDELRGCMGCLQSSEPLASSVASSAFNAAFGDRRFSKLTIEEKELIDIEISVLSEMEALEVTDRQSLLDQLIPGKDGLLLEDLRYRSTFLPGVWEKLPDPAEFLEQLFLKAGLGRDYWSKSILFYRYRAVSFNE